MAHRTADRGTDSKPEDSAQLLDHGSSCPGCAAGMCEVARGLWRQVKRRPESP